MTDNTTIYVNKIEPMNIYAPFGKHQLNLKKLKGGRLQLRSKTDNVIANIKSKQLTKNMKVIIDKFITNQPIEFEDVEILDDDEKDYLAEISEKCNINDRLRIPSPKLTKIQSDINKFNILRGEIIAGNDSKELVRDFKVLLLKLMNSKHISKSEGNNIMIMLLQLGL
tara:strand:+ start:593 stop:1096 length:504 start_codon:yes stop_codon:yes gene_type:complete